MSPEKLTLYAVDLDKTLLDTEAIFTETVILCDQQGIADQKALLEARTNVESSGESFDLMNYLKNEGTSDEAMNSLIKILGTNEQRKEFLYPDSRDFLEVLDSEELPNLILTYGSVDNQLTKLRASGLDQRPYLITADSKKGELISKWEGIDGYYRVATAVGQALIGRSVVLIDDKAKSFSSLPEDCLGFLVQRQQPKLPQTDNLPEKVVVVPDLATITEIIR